MKTNKVTIGLLVLLLAGCSKYLDKKPDKSLSTPTKISELQGLLDYPDNNIGFPIAGELANDNFYYTTEDWNSIFLPEEKLAYVWDAQTDMAKDWEFCYQKVFLSNVVLDALDKMERGNTTEHEAYDNVKGSALFLRAFTFYELAQVFAPPYSPETASLPFGIPLKTSPNIDEKTTRSTVGETYEKIITDLKKSIQLLPATAKHFSRPGKAASYALLARAYLSMRDYLNAGVYADSSLLTYNMLINYNDPDYVNPSNDVPFLLNNKEILFLAVARYIGENYRTRVAPELFAAYDTSDIRKTAFYLDNGDGSYQFKGNYYGTNNTQLFCGISTNEVYLIAAECKARQGDLPGSKQLLDALLEKRWIAGTYTPLAITDQLELLQKILSERRKELCFRGNLRWTDLRRLNQEEGLKQTLTRVIDGGAYTLAPGDNRYTFLVPYEVIDMSGIEQNPR